MSARVALAICAIMIPLLIMPGGIASALKDPQALQQNKLDRLEAETDGLYLASLEGNRQSAYRHLQQIESLLKDSSTVGEARSEGIEQLRRDILQIRASVNSGGSPEWRLEIAAVKMAVDALLHGEDALWLSYEKLMLEDLRAYAQARQAGGLDGAIAAQSALSRFTEHARIIETAALMQRETHEVQELMERIRYSQAVVQAASAEPERRIGADEIDVPLRYAVESLFAPGGKLTPNVELPASGGPSWQWTAILGSLIIAILLYAGWRKYRQEG